MMVLYAKRRRQRDGERQPQWRGQPPPPYPGLDKTSPAHASVLKEKIQPSRDSISVSTSSNKATLWQKLCDFVTNPVGSLSHQQKRDPALKHVVNSLHFPPNAHQWEHNWEDSPWWARLRVFLTEPETLSELVPWRRYPDSCYEDDISILDNKQERGEMIYQRRISWGLQVHVGPVFLRDRLVSVIIYSKNAQWLADLSRPDISGFISLESCVR